MLPPRVRVDLRLPMKVYPTLSKAQALESKHQIKFTAKSKKLVRLDPQIGLTDATNPGQSNGKEDVVYIP